MDALLTGESITGTVELDDRLTEALYHLLGRPLHAHGCAPWAVLLFPTLLDPDLAVPETARELYRSLTWYGPLAPGRLDVRVETEYLLHNGESLDLGIHTVATTADGSTGRAFSVLRLVGQTPAPPSFGTPRRPPLLTVGTTTTGRRFVIDEHTLDQFLEVARVDSRVVASSSEAHSQGLANRLVPSALLMAAATRDHHAEAGEIEMWFTRPSPAGALLNVGIRTSNDSWVGEVLLPSGRAVAAFAIRDAEPPPPGQ